MKELKELFYKFLKNHDCLEEYLENFDRAYCMSEQYALTVTNLLRLSFNWDNSNQSYKYWFNKERIWEEHYLKDDSEYNWIDLEDILEIKDYLMERVSKEHRLPLTDCNWKESAQRLEDKIALDSIFKPIGKEYDKAILHSLKHKGGKMKGVTEKLEGIYEAINKNPLLLIGALILGYSAYSKRGELIKVVKNLITTVADQLKDLSNE